MKSGMLLVKTSSTDIVGGVVMGDLRSRLLFRYQILSRKHFQSIEYSASD